MKSVLFGTARSNSAVNDTGLLLLRVFAGLAMAFGHGIGKIPPSEKFIDGVEAMGFPLPFIFAWAASLSEFLGGIFIALGLLTRPSAFFLVITMATAAFVRNAGDGFSGQEKAMLYMFVYGALLFTGAGRFSLDGLVNGKKR